MNYRYMFFLFIILLSSCSSNRSSEKEAESEGAQSENNIEKVPDGKINPKKVDQGENTQVPEGEQARKPKICHNPDFIKQVTLGYQGWFGAKGDGVGNAWKHWSRYNTVPAVNNVTFELYPDVSEYHPSDLFTTKLGKLGNGKPAKLFSSARDGVVELHFQWMTTYGLDGIALQRFSSELKHKNSLKHNNEVAQLVKKYAEKYCRTYYIMYDLSGSSVGNVTQNIKSDWNNVLVKQLKITESHRYVHYKNKPVIGLWGLGFNTDAHKFSKKQALDLIKWFRQKGFYIVGGVPYNWRTEKLDSRENWLEVYQKYDMILPWSVGRYRENEELLHHYQAIWKPDLLYGKQNNLQMKRVIFPGFAWSNWNHGARNEIPRKRGDFFWQQAYLTNQLGLGAYIAMFDEYDEATAIAKAATNKAMLPKQQYFLDLSERGQNISSDFYLRLSEKVTQMIHGRQGFNRSVPVK